MKSLLATICILAIVGMAVGVTIVMAGDTVNCTVTPGNYAVSVLPTSDPHGGMTLVSSHTGTKITATNDGSLTAKLTIIGADATYTEGGKCGDGVCTWTLSTSAPGTDIYVHAFSTKDPAPTTNGTLGSDPTVEWVALDKGSTYKTLVATKGSGLTQDFYLDMRTPATGSTETDYGSEYSTDVTVAAGEPD
jgi:hypothetical protein